MKWTMPGCRPLGLDETIEDGDWVADCFDGDLSIGAPGQWTRAQGTLGLTPRKARVFACRPIRKEKMAAAVRRK
jgi:hypothetical protein